MPRGSSVPLFIEHEIIALWKNHKPQKYITYVCKVCPQTVYNTLKKYNIPRRAKKVVRGQMDLFIHLGGIKPGKRRSRLPM